MNNLKTIRKICLIIFGMFLFSFTNMIFVSSLSIAVHVPEKYTDVVAGERFYFEMEVKYPENPSRKDLRLEYRILTFEGEVIAQSKVLKAIETQASFIDFIVIPESAKKGIHLIQAKIKDYEDLSEEVEASFYITSGTGDQIKLYFFILLGVIVLMGFLVIIGIFFGRKKN